MGLTIGGGLVGLAVLEEDRLVRLDEARASKGQPGLPIPNVKNVTLRRQGWLLCLFEAARRR